MRILVKILIILAVLLGVVGPSTTAEAASSQMPLSRQEFEALAEELAPKVNLFAEVWRADPSAQFLGGTTRDYLYWLKGQIMEAHRKGRLAERIAELRSEEVIDVKKFILYQSDIDVIASRRLAIDVSRFGIKKLDLIAPTRFDSATREGQDEIRQGFVPAEKVRLGPRGFILTSAFGDGFGEIYSSKPTVHFSASADFDSTRFAEMGLNHPVLMALRYIRIAAMDYFQNHGRVRPDAKTLIASLDPASREAVRRVFADALTDPKLNAAMRNEKFRDWFNLAVQKAFRSYTNPDATMALFKEFGADRLVGAYPGIGQINQYLFSANYDPVKIAANLDAYGVDRSSFYEKVASHFPEGKIYHGTRDEVSFRSILFQGTLPSDGGTAGSGLYGVAKSNIAFAIDWGKDERRVVEIKVSPKTRLVDVTRGEGQRVFAAFSARHRGGGDVHSAFADAFGVDVIRYVYHSDAYVVKNGAVLESATGYKRKLMTLSEIVEVFRLVSRDKTKLSDILNLLQDNSLSAKEIEWLSAKSNLGNLVELLVESKEPLTIDQFRNLWSMVKVGAEPLDPKSETRLAKLLGRLSYEYELAHAGKSRDVEASFKELIETLDAEWLNLIDPHVETRRAIFEFIDRERQRGNPWVMRFVTKPPGLGLYSVAMTELPASDPRKTEIAAYMHLALEGNSESATYGFRKMMQQSGLDAKISAADWEIAKFQVLMPSIPKVEPASRPNGSARAPINRGASCEALFH